MSVSTPSTITTTNPTLFCDHIDSFDNESVGLMVMTKNPDGQVELFLGFRKDKKKSEAELEADWIGGTIDVRKSSDESYSDVKERVHETGLREFDEEIGPEACDILNATSEETLSSYPHIALWNESKDKWIWLILKVIHWNQKTFLLDAATAYVLRKYVNNPSRDPMVSYHQKFGWVPIESVLNMCTNSAAAFASSQMNGVKKVCKSTFFTASDGQQYPTRMFLGCLTKNSVFPTWLKEASKASKVFDNDDLNNVTFTSIFPSILKYVPQNLITPDLIEKVIFNNETCLSQNQITSELVEAAISADNIEILNKIKNVVISDGSPFRSSSKQLITDELKDIPVQQN